jgi:hypothetical protein
VGHRYFSARRFMDFELRFTDKEITAWGGMAIMKRMLDHMGFGAALTNSGLPPPGSNRGYAPEQLITQFMLSVWCGANRFEHGEVTRHDPVLKRIFGFTRMANFKAVMRLFRRFTQSTNEGVMDSLYRWMFDQISINGITLDVDSTVMTRYGCQDGAAKGYNPAKRGRASHHPLMAFVSETRIDKPTAGCAQETPARPTMCKAFCVTPESAWATSASRSCAETVALATTPFWSTLRVKACTT